MCIAWRHGTGGKAMVTVLKGTDPSYMSETSYQFEVDGNSNSAEWKVNFKKMRPSHLIFYLIQL
jgi:hypothetical protein